MVNLNHVGDVRCQLSLTLWEIDVLDGAEEVPASFGELTMAMVPRYVEALLVQRDFLESRLSYLKAVAG